MGSGKEAIPVTAPEIRRHDPLTHPSPAPGGEVQTLSINGATLGTVRSCGPSDPPAEWPQA